MAKDEPDRDLAEKDRDSLIRELRDLARHAPDRLTARLQTMTVREQADLALRLPADERLELLLHAPKPMRLVRTLPDLEIYLTAREVGPGDALPLLSLASAQQLQHLLDLESWRKDRMDAKRAGAWVAVFLEAGEPTLRRFLRNADDDFLSLLFQQWIRPHQPDSGDSDGSSDPHGTGMTETGDEHGFASPDGAYLFSPIIPEHAPVVRRLAALFFLEQPARYRQILWTALWSLPSELEENALHWRNSRLEEHGFPPWEEALSVYAPPAETRELPEPPASPQGEIVAAPRAALRMAQKAGTLAPVLDALPLADRERALHQITAVANRLLVADSADTGDPQTHRAFLEKTTGYVSIALEARKIEDPARAVALLREVPVIELFREGYAFAARLQERARGMKREGWLASHPSAVELLDAPVRQRVAALLLPRPLYFDVAAGPDRPYRDFHTVGELEETRVALELADSLGRLFVNRLGLDVAGLLRFDAERPERARFSTVLLTALARFATRGEFSAAPLSAEAVAEFLRTTASRKTADPGEPRRALARWFEQLRHRGLTDAGELPLLSAFGRACLEKLAEECGTLDPGVPLDPRFVSCLLLAPITGEGNNR